MIGQFLRRVSFKSSVEYRVVIELSTNAAGAFRDQRQKRGNVVSAASCPTKSMSGMQTCRANRENSDGVPASRCIPRHANDAAAELIYFNGGKGG